ncbi:DUF2243 domain-containing protein [Bordetella genomosp. 1]|uniref:DUF2243 domain-containing protein n=1 Tax=Bordetella genomosp. 1 TaxID=1395607 RepID=A0ABX4EWM6_9BORD|nr:DUF2243 domain-containing protein [Bordetella genomosp. 1]OZI58833.1 hypothetical protein CAL27_19355 [Bordetella genomosp. 1]
MMRAETGLTRAGLLLGFAMGGFFDGILLHQILQWHHLLSAIQSGPYASLRMQVTVDGLFHALMYVVAALGLWQLHRARAAIDGQRRRLWGAFWMGFGGWHAIDAVVSHWLLGIHRIRMDTEVPLLWDLGWLAVFGLLPLLAGWRMQRGDGAGPPARSRRGAAALGLLIAGAAALNLFPPREDLGTTVVTLRPGASPAALIQSLAERDARVVWSSADGGVWVLHGLALRDRIALYGAGALYVSGAATPSGCSAWVSPSARVSL